MLFDVARKRLHQDQPEAGARGRRIRRSRARHARRYQAFQETLPQKETDPAIMKLSPQFLEAVNGVLLVVYVAILFFFGRYIVEGIRRYGWLEGRHHRRAAIAVSTLILGDTVIRAFIWTLRHVENTRGASSKAHLAIATIGTTAGVLICIVGGVCILRHFAPAKLGHWPSIVTIALALAFGIGMVL
jgi:hypothetical protein